MRTVLECLGVQAYSPKSTYPSCCLLYDHESQVMEEWCDKVFETLEVLECDDPITECFSANCLHSDLPPAILLQHAHEKLHVFPFKDVQECWKRLYTDASVRKALTIFRLHLQRPHEDFPANWLNDIIVTLDMALIMTGAPRREKLIEHIFSELQQHADKSSHLRDCQPSLDTFPVESYKAPQIEKPIRRTPMNLSGFEKHLETKRPILLIGELSLWPAFKDQKWSSPSYLLSKTFGGKRLVPIELGRSYTDDGFGQAIMPFGDFMSNYLLITSGKDIGYLAQHDLFSQIPDLQKDIRIPIFCSTNPPPPAPGTPLANAKIPHLETPLTKMWLGPAGTISPLHTDPYHNILSQVVGKKYVRLYSPHESSKLYPRGTTDDGIDMSNTSRVEAEQVEMSLEEDSDGEFPLFAKANYVETILNEGDCLYIPVGWWHYVRSLTASISVSFWWN